MAEFFNRKNFLRYAFNPFSVPYGIGAFLVLTALMNVLFSQSLTGLYLIMYLSFLFYYFASAYIIPKKHQVVVESNSGNTFKSISVALIILMAFLVGSFFITSSASGFSPNQFLEQSASAFLGSNVEPIFAQSKPVIFGAFAFYIPFVETALYIAILATLLFIMSKAFGVKLLEDTTRFGVLKKWQFWLANAIAGAGAVWFHLTAKGVSDLPLLLVFSFFMLSGAIAMVREKPGGKREMETAIWLHIFNNGLAMLVKLGLLSAWGFML